MSTLKVNNVTDLGDDAVITDGALVGAGKILQVVQAVKTDGDFSTTAGSFTTVTGLTATITPSSTSSKVLILAQVSTGFGNNSSGTFRIAGGNSTTYVGDSSGSKTRGVIGQHANTVGFSSNDEFILHSYSMIFLDSPATVSPITYSVEAFRNLGTVFVNRPGVEPDNANTTRGASSITLMEVAG